MAAITVAIIQELRNRTNAGMMDCKKALAETNGDIEEAIKILRTKGQAVQLKRADKEAKQGLVAAAGCEKCGAYALVEVNCETDFVAKTEGFQAFVKKAAEPVVSGETNLADALKDDIGDLVAKTGEKTIINRSERYTLQGPGMIKSYIHMGGKIGVLVEVGCEKAETAASPDFADLVFDIALQIAGAAPRWLKRDEVPQDVIDSETELNRKKLEETEREKGGKPKPAEILQKIAAGQINKFFGEACLVEQQFVKNEPGVKKTVQQVIDECAKKLGDKIAVRRYARFQLGA
jgi:elongation factor Ts